MANSTLTLANLVDPAIKSLYDERRDQIIAKGTDYDKFPYIDFLVDNIDADKLSSVSGFGPGTLTIQGQQYGEAYRYDGYDKTLVLRKYTQNFPWTEELEFELERKSAMGIFKVRSLTEGLADSLIMNWEQDWAKMFYLGQGTTFITGGDGVALISASHPSSKPGLAVQSNIITSGGTTNPTLTATSLKNAFIQMDRFTDNAGVLMASGRRFALVVTRQLKELANQIKWSDYGPSNANLGYSQVGPTIRNKDTMDFEVKVLNWIPDAYASYWFVVDLDRMENMVALAYAWKPRMSDQLKEYNGVSHVLASTLFGPNPRDWRWIAGSTGANAVS